MSVTPISKAAGWRRAVEAPDDAGPLDEFIDRFKTHLDAAGRAPKTIERYVRAARQLATWAGGSDLMALTRSDLEAYIVYRREETSPATANTDFISLQQFFKFIKLDLGAGGEAFTSPLAGMSAPRFVAPIIQIIPIDILKALIQRAETATYERGQQDRSFEDARDAAILRMFIDTGARLSEVTNLSLNQVVSLPRLTLIGKSKGHGPVSREVEIGSRAHKAMRKYLRVRQGHPDAESTALWLGKRGPLTPNGVRQMIRKRGAKEGVHIHPHMFRHTRADQWLTGQGSEGDLMKLMGWKSDEMPKRYGSVRAGERALENQRTMGLPGDLL